LCQTGHWLNQLGRLGNGVDGEQCPDLRGQEIRDLRIESDLPFGRLRHVAPAVQLSETSAHWARPTVPYGFHRPEWAA
jgi:hypothetical protein